MDDSLLPGAAAPGLDEPLEILEACHGRIEAQLRTLEKLCAHLPIHGADAQARQAAQAIMRYFDTAGRHHHCDEEDDLFPRLRERAPQVAPVLDALGEQHRRMEDAWASLRAELDAVSRGAAQLPAPRGAAFAALYREHIERENRDVLPLAKRVLNAADVAALRRAMTARRRIT